MKMHLKNSFQVVFAIISNIVIQVASMVAANSAIYNSTLAILRVTSLIASLQSGLSELCEKSLFKRYVQT
jgi:hypothetical protein